jgi:hypothetical protein
MFPHLLLQRSALPFFPPGDDCWTSLEKNHKSGKPLERPKKCHPAGRILFCCSTLLEVSGKNLSPDFCRALLLQNRKELGFSESEKAGNKKLK